MRHVPAIAMVVMVWGAPAYAADVSLQSSGSYRVGTPLKVTITGVGPLVLDSSLKASSQQLEVMGQKTVEVGSVPAAGVETVIVRDDTGAKSLTLFFMPEGGEHVRIAQLAGRSATPASAAATQASEAAMKIFYGKLSSPVMKTALNKALPRWLAEHPAGLTGTLTVCGVSFAMAPAVAGCLKSGGDLTISLAAAVLIQAAKDLKDAGALTAAQAQQVTTTIDRFQKGAEFILGSVASNVLTAVGTALEATTERDDVKIIIRVTIDHAKKVVALIELKPK